MKKKPNFFIVGAPKCGTTALSEYLKEHPNVFISTTKEPHYFASDMVYHRTIENGDDYLTLFKETTEEHIAVGEASVWYLYSEKAIQNIYSFNENAKIIIMLRKPVDMVYSMHSQQIQSIGEDILDFEKAWDMEDERKQGRSIPKHILHIPNLYYSEIAKYNTQLNNLYKFFPKKQVKIILFDDFKKDTKKIYNEVLKFLDLPLYDKKVFPVVNENSIIRNKFIAILLRNKFYIPKKILEKTKILLQLQNKGLHGVLYDINKMKIERAQINNIIKKRVILHYKNEVDLLAKLLNKDLTEWNKL